jgi:tripartite ATP-independent transporter DctM subunit
MDAIGSSLFFLIMMLFFLGSGVWIFASLILVSIIGLATIVAYPMDRIGAIMVKRLYAASGSWEIACIPLFMWMAEIMFRTDFSERLFRGLAPLVDKLPGRLLHTNVAGCALFAAVSGSSTATTATIGKITIAELQKRDYNRNLAIGSLAGAGSFGLMIPPSIVFIIYGVIAEESISRLFMAGVFPGLLLAGLYSTFIVVFSIFRPNVAPAAGVDYTARDYLRCIGLLMPILILIVIVLGSIYTGIATPTEAAAVGVTAALIMAVAFRQMTLSVFVETILGALKTSCMVCSLLAAAAFLSTAMGFLHVPQDISRIIGTLQLTPYGLMVVLGVFYVVLGFFLDGISITVMSLPICLPLVVAAGFDPIWFGVFLVAMTELAQITPPVGFNLFVIQGLTGYSIGYVAYAAAPFFVMMVIGVMIITFFPEIALWLPSALLGK